MLPLECGATSVVSLNSRACARFKASTSLLAESAELARSSQRGSLVAVMIGLISSFVINVRVSLPERLISHSKFPGTARPGSGGSIRPSISAALGPFHRRVSDRLKSHEEIVQFGGAWEEASLSSTFKKARCCRFIPFGTSRPDTLSKYTNIGEFRISLADSSEYSSFRITPYTLVIYQCALLEYVVCAATLCVSLSAGSFLWPR